MDMDSSVVIAGGGGVQVGGAGCTGRSGDGTRRDLGGEHTTQCTDDVLWNCASETCVILLTSVRPMNSIKRKKLN